MVLFFVGRTMKDNEGEFARGTIQARTSTVKSVSTVLQDAKFIFRNSFFNLNDKTVTV